MIPRDTAAMLLWVTAPTLAQVVSYEGDSFPEDAGFQRRQVLFQADRSLEDGWFVEHTETLEQPPPNLPVDEEDIYDYGLQPFSGADSFFVEWRMLTDGTAQGIPNVSPAALVAGGYSGVFYHVTIAEDQVRLIDSDLSVLLFSIAPGVPHTYRLDLNGGESYAFSIDGEVADVGTPAGAYPTSDSTITFGARAPGEAATTRWDYIRFGVIPEPATVLVVLLGSLVVFTRHR